MVIIVLGLPGSGKSYFASRFAELLHARYINSDQIRKNIFPDMSYSEKDKLSVYDEMLEFMRMAISQNKDLVLDGTFYKEEIRKRFKDEAKNRGNIIFIEIAAEESVVRERLKQKRLYSEADFEVYKIMKDQWEPVCGHRLILISTNDNIEDMLHQAVEYLKLREDKGAYC